MGCEKLAVYKVKAQLERYIAGPPDSDGGYDPNNSIDSIDIRGLVHPAPLIKLFFVGYCEDSISSGVIVP